MELIEFPRARLDAIQRTTVLVLERGAIFEIRGPGAVDCLQGLLTNDLVKPGPGSLVYGGMLTSKGMIVADFWVIRLDDGFVLVTHRNARDAARELFRKQLPPRLARVVDRSDDWQTLWVVGGDFAPAVSPFGELPPAGRSRRLTVEFPNSAVATPLRSRPFHHLVVGPDGELASLAERLTASGIEAGNEWDLRASRVVAGWPTLGQEIDERTMPAEVRFEEIDGVSYTKGCYVGQETVARVHFRGHPNWVLRGIRFDGSIALEPEIAIGGRPAIRLRTVLRFEDGSGIGLASVRREVEPGSIEGTGLEIVRLPFPD